MSQTCSESRLCPRLQRPGKATAWVWVGGGTVWGAGVCCKGVHSEQCGATAWQSKVMGAAAIIQAAGTAEGIKAAGLERTGDSPGTGSGVFGD